MEELTVPGRITVVDFWARWCRPCEALDRELRALAAEHPALAVRRVEVPTTDCDAARALGDDTRIPQVWIHERDGTVVDHLVGPGPAYLRARLEALLGAP